MKEPRKLLNKAISHVREIYKCFKLQSNDVLINSVQAIDASLVVTESSGIESEKNSSENALSKSVNETQMQMQERKVDMGKALDDGSVVTKNSGTKSDKRDTNNRLGNDADTEDAVIKLVNDQEPLAEVPTGKTFTSSTTKVDSEPLNGSNEDITNPYECEQTLNVSACTLNLSTGTPFNPKKERLRVWLLKKLMFKNQVPQGIHNQEQSPNRAQGVKEQQQRAYSHDPCYELLHKVYISHGSSSNENQLNPQLSGQQLLEDAPLSSTSSTQEQEQALNISQGFEESPKTPMFRDDPLNESPHEESTPQGSSSNVRQTHTLFEHLGRWTKDHPIENVIGDPSHSILARNDSVDTPMVEKSKPDEDLQGKPVDATHYQGSIGSLMYLTSSRPDLIYAVCLCARYQAKPTEKHLNTVKRIF
uniref:Uncharacterized mitochondrial protein AtMg00810-like n=1 Tax=Tanacetum cinerariifolium TaxID=118510 RepID=A0A6L2LDG1_TANCI|nr:uncharacterized mitochondrial protein AtMg00810-like [Tanacetum cinerariifolium]